MNFGNCWLSRRWGPCMFGISSTGIVSSMTPWIPLITTDSKSNAKNTGTIKVISAKLSKSDDFFPASNFASSWNLGSDHGGELSRLQVDVRKFLARKPRWSRVTDDGVQTRAHLEDQMASALALKSPKEYRQCLVSYVRFLAREADESRLREICENFLGPPVGMAEAGSSNLKTREWDPFVLGMNKHNLLQDDILPSMASNRKVQRLLNEFMDRLSGYESTETTLDEKNLASAICTTNSDSTAVDKTNLVEPIKYPVLEPTSETTELLDDIRPTTTHKDIIVEDLNQE